MTITQSKLLLGAHKIQTKNIMGRSVKRKKLTSDDLMRQLEDPGRQWKRPRLDTGSAEENDSASAALQDSEEDDDEENDSKHIKLPESHLGLGLSSSSSSSGISEIFSEPDMNSEPLSAYVALLKVRSE